MRVLISGAGIAGLGLALRQRGLTPILVERAPRLRAAPARRACAPRLRDGGYMLGLADPGLGAAERMGLAAALRVAWHMPRRLVYMDGDGLERFANDGVSLDRLMGERRFNLLRRDIERALHERVRGEVEVRFGASAEALDVTPDGVGVRLTNGEEIGCDLVVGADGLHSRVRTLRFGPEERFVRAERPPVHTRESTSVACPRGGAASGRVAGNRLAHQAAPQP